MYLKENTSNRKNSFGLYAILFPSLREPFDSPIARTKRALLLFGIGKVCFNNSLIAKRYTIKFNKEK